MRKLLLFLLLLPTIAFAQGTATQIRSGSSLPTACGVAYGGTIFYKTTSPIGHYECSVAGNPGTWRQLYGATTGASGSDGYIQLASSGAFASDSRIKFDVATGVFTVGDGTTQGIVKLFDGSSHYVGLKSPTSVTSYTWLFPAADGSGCLQSDGAGNLSIGSCGTSGLADPGSNGIIKRTALNTTAAAAAADVVGLFNSGTCSGYLKSDGTCDTPAGGSTVSDAIAQSPDLTPGSPNALDDEFSGSSLSGSWTQVNDTGVTFTVNGSLLTFNAPTNSGDSVRQILKTAPATPWTVTTRMLAHIGNQGNFTFTGICIGDSGTAGNVTIFGPAYRQNVGQAEFSVVNFSNNTTFSSYSKNYVDWGGTGASYGPYWNRWVYLQVNNDGTNITFKASMTGTGGSYDTVYGPVAKTTFLTTINRIGLCIDNNDSSLPGIAMFDYFRVN